MAHGWGDSMGGNAPVNQTTGWGELPEMVEGASSGAGTWGDGANNGGWESTPYGQPHRWNTESPINWELENKDMGEQSEEAAQSVAAGNGGLNSSYVEQIPPDSYAAQTRQYTQAALDQLLHSPQYQRRHTQCRLCWCVWSEQQYSPSCNECGGFAMQRPCPICEGRCGKIWHRDVDLSHSHHHAYWDGKCGLPASQQQGYLQQVLVGNASEEDIIEGMTELNTG